MTPLSPMDLDMLDFLCICAEKKIKVVRVNVTREAALARLRDLGLVHWNRFEPSPSALVEWIERQRIRSEAATCARAPDELPAPKAAAEGGGDARCAEASPPILAECEEFLKRSGMSVTAFGAAAAGDLSFVQRMRKGRVPTEQTVKRVHAWIASGARPEPNTKGVRGTARKAPSAASSGAAKRTKGQAPTDGPALRSCPPARAHPAVDIKVTSRPRRDPTLPPKTPLIDQRERQTARGHQHAAAVRRSQEAQATRLLDAGVHPASQSSLTRNLMIAVQRRRDEEARLLDPVEQAKTILRKRYTPVVGAEFADPPGRKGTFLVGRKIVSTAELLDMAGIAA